MLILASSVGIIFPSKKANGNDDSLINEIKKLSAYLNILTRTKLAMRFQWNNNLENRFLDNLVSTIVKLENRGKATVFAKEYLLKKIEILKNL